MRVGLFVPCYIDAFYPEVGIATLELLERFGLDISYPLDQTCCGQPMVNSLPGFFLYYPSRWQAPQALVAFVETLRRHRMARDAETKEAPIKPGSLQTREPPDRSRRTASGREPARRG